ncbi:MAG TPA: acetyl-CoA carboxylase biotin carboxyl carrier protein [Thermoanaerobaculia bacterium]|nr:acetyl-CoA carboxylase biotin carboxyl carrier protein [Thermoanaerobaculia bacterium]
MLTFEQIKELIQLVSERGLQGVEIERSGFRLKIDGRPAAPAAASAGPAPLANGTAASLATEAAPAAPAAKTSPLDGTHILNSPIVGTFYQAPSPDAPPFVAIGSRVRKGQVLCIIEAMKLMNEIESDVDGEIVETFPQNAQAVEFGEPLYAIRT